MIWLSIQKFKYIYKRKFKAKLLEYFTSLLEIRLMCKSNESIFIYQLE